MTSMKNWEPEWVCKCGQRWRASDGLLFQGSPLPEDRFLMFGFHKRCPRCGGDVGSEGPRGQVRCEISRFRRSVRRQPGDWWWKPWTWFRRVEWKHEIRGEDGP
jgi:hypothetical protein